MQKTLSDDSGIKAKHILVLDAGTTGIKALLFNERHEIIARSYERLEKSVHGEKVEQNPLGILQTSIRVIKKSVKDSGLSPDEIKGLSITNQRETFVLWNKTTGEPLYPAIVWEDARTKNFCEENKERYEKIIREKTGLTLDPYFSATKISWILNNVPMAREAYEKSELLFGTIDSWLLFNLGEGRPHLTDHTNASRTLLFNIRELKWDEELLNIFDIPSGILPQALPSRSPFGILNQDILGQKIPVLALSGDQQASMFAAGTSPGDTKITLGTGTFIMHILNDFEIVENFFTTLVPAKNGQGIFALEAKIPIGSKDADPLIGKPEMSDLLRTLAQKIKPYVLSTPHRPQFITIDGGISQAENIEKIFQEEIGIRIRKQVIFDGTALGAAMLAE